MTKLSDLFDPLVLAQHVADGYVRVQVHPKHHLSIFNYSEKTAYEGKWDEVTLACRGLIVALDPEPSLDGEVVARPFGKFFNYGQTGAAEIPLDAPVHVTDKCDGSLGILYPLPDDAGYAIATRGSFASEQAVHATKLFQRKYADDFIPLPDETLLVEIIYPANRIVLDYGDMDDLVLLGAVEIPTGRVIRAEDEEFIWPGPITKTFTAGTLAEALAMEPRENAEGIVVRSMVTGAMLKIKQEDYTALHKIVTGLNARVVWRHLMDGKPLADLVAPLPDEFHPWCQQVADVLELEVEVKARQLQATYDAVVADMPKGFSRKEFAQVAAPHPDKWALFLMLDGRDVRPEIWKHVEPAPFITPSGRTYTEDTA
jgi:RNA ligase